MLMLLRDFEPMMFMLIGVMIDFPKILTKRFFSLLYVYLLDYSSTLFTYYFYQWKRNQKVEGAQV